MNFSDILSAISSLFGGNKKPQVPDPDYTGIKVTVDYTYGLGVIDKGKIVELKSDFYENETKPTADEAVLVVHGGGFTGGNKSDKPIKWICTRLAKAGYDVLAINYRLQKQNPPAPVKWSLLKRQGMHAASVDAIQALRILHTRPYRHVYVLGESAGAIALVQACSAPLQFMTDTSESNDVNREYPLPADVTALVSLWGGTGLAQIDKDFPTSLIIHGDKDRTPGASISDSISLCAQLRRAGVSYQFISLTDQKHGAWTAKTSIGDLADTAIDFFRKAKTNA